MYTEKGNLWRHSAGLHLRWCSSWVFACETNSSPINNTSFSLRSEDCLSLFLASFMLPLIATIPQSHFRPEGRKVGRKERMVIHGDLIDLLWGKVIFPFILLYSLNKLLPHLCLPFFPYTLLIMCWLACRLNFHHTAKGDKLSFYSSTSSPSYLSRLQLPQT